MKRDIWLWEFLGFGVTSLCGTLLHFLYDWTGQSVLAAPFSGVNESTFEHTKLIFWPMLIFAVVQCFFFRECRCYWCVKLSGILTGVFSIPVIFYTYNGIFGKSPDWLNITIFFISAAIAYFAEMRLFYKEHIKKCNDTTAVVLICVIAFFFIYYTFKPPMLPFFADPITGGYGIL